SAATNDSQVATAAIAATSRLRLAGVAPGRTGLRLRDASSGAVRHLGVRVREPDGSLPGLPAHVAIGSVSEDTESDLALWRSFEEGALNTRVELRYVYLNGGPFGGWYDWQGGGGSRARTFIRESKKLGMIPVFVYYDIPNAGESYATDLAHVQDAAYVGAYFADLARALDIVHDEGGDDPVGIVLEPDFIGYLMQLSGRRPDQIAAAVHAAYDAGVLSRASDPAFPDTVVGFVSAVNHLIARRAPNAFFGWQVNLWASLTDGSGIPATGLMRITDSLGIAAGRDRIRAEARKIAEYYAAAGILDHGAHFVSIDKYGLDGGFGSGAAAPWSSTWFWNAIHWNNYLVFAGEIARATAKPIVLWQIPVGHVNASLAPDPRSAGALFPP